MQANFDLICHPKTFFGQVCKCRELLADQRKNMYFATIRNSELKNQPKGLDDLLVSEHENAAVVMDDLLAVSRKSNFFEKFDITYETRQRDILYWVRKIPVSTADRIDMLNAMIEEIPHFLFFLNKREMHTKAKSRMWFSPDEIHTEALDLFGNSLIVQIHVIYCSNQIESERKSSSSVSIFFGYNSEYLYISNNIFNTYPRR